jgi:EAL domain-containing protein (putative c-di-GMP-specific phosphodiesterase class I)
MSIDDFGTGYSCLICLDKFPLDVLKIDRSFMAKLSLEGKKSQIVRTVVALAHKLRMKVTAEAVETSEQLRIVQSWGLRIRSRIFIC